MSKIFAGDVGTELILECGVDISSATLRRIKVRKPDNSLVTWTATSNTSTSIKYIVQAGDLDLEGTYKLQALITMPSWSGSGEPTNMFVSSGV